MSDAVQVGLAAVITAVVDDDPRIVVVRSGFEIPDDRRRGDCSPLHRDSLPGAAFRPDRFRTLQDAVRDVAEGLCGLNLRYVEQLYTFGDRFRDPHELFGGTRAIAVAYLALVRDAPLRGDATAEWRPLYDHFPWEDWREDRPEVLDRVILPALARWVAATPDPHVAARRRERVGLAFGTDGETWNAESVLERYELLYEADLAEEALRDRWLAGAEPPVAPADPALGRPMARDGRRVLASGIERLRGKLRYRPIVFELMPPAFTLNALQRTVEALNGQRLHKQNFRRLVVADELVEPTGEVAVRTGGRPAELYRFRRAAIHERTSARAGIEEDPAGD